jgi:hypothetical protein
MIQKQPVWRLIFFLLLAFVVISQATTADRPAAATNERSTAVPASLTAVPKTFSDVCVFDSPPNALFLPMLAVSGEAPPPQPMLRELQYEVGKTYVYDYQMSSHSQFGTVSREQGIQDDGASVVLSYGRARIDITDRQGDVFTGYVALDDPTICLQDPEGPGEFIEDPDILAELQTPLMFKQHKHGAIVDVQMAATVSPETANFLKGILNSLQATLAADDAYAAIETGGQGVYEANYSAALRSDGLHLTKKITDEGFSELHSLGDMPGVALDNTVQMTLDRERGVFRYVSFYETTDVLDEDPREIDPEEIEGVAIWGLTRSWGKLELTAVEQTPASLLARTSQLTYNSVGMAAYLGEIHPPTYGIDMDLIDLEAELDAYAAASSDDLDAYVRMRQIMAVDSRNPTAPIVPAAIADRLLDSLDDDALAKQYISLLSNDGSPYAQSIVRRLIDPADPLFAQVSPGVQMHVFAGLSLLDDPQPETYNLMPTILNSALATEELKTMALMAWGSFGQALADTDENMSNAIYNDLASRLSTAVTPEQTSLILLALGNTGHPGLVNLIAAYLPENDPNVNEQVEIAAYWALRFVPGPQAEEILIKALEDEGGIVKPVPKDTAATSLKNRPGKPSDNANNALAGYHGSPPQPGGEYKDSWNWSLGGDNLGASLPGSVVLETIPGLNGHAVQDVNYRLNIDRFNYHRSGTLASARAFTYPVNQSVQKFGYSYSLFGKDIAPLQYNLPCANSDGDEILGGPIDMYTANFKYPVYWVFKVGVELKAYGKYHVSYEYSWDLCTPGALSADIALLGHGSATVSAYGYLEAGLGFRGGPKLEATIFSIDAEAKLRGTYTTQDGFEACLHVPLELKAGHVYFFIQAERWKVTEWAWGPIAGSQKLIWDYALYTGTINIIPPVCVQP